MSAMRSTSPAVPVVNVTAQAAWQALAADKRAQLIDVRSAPEWAFSGVADLSSIGKKTITVSWKDYPTMEQNPSFEQQVSQAIPDLDTPLYFLCKTGGRSLAAAMAMSGNGYAQCYNIEQGFEGDRDSRGRRGTMNGWKASDLPWEQA